jgi:hypothetical protein
MYIKKRLEKKESKHVGLKKSAKACGFPSPARFSGPDFILKKLLTGPVFLIRQQMSCCLLCAESGNQISLEIWNVGFWS